MSAPWIVDSDLKWTGVIPRFGMHPLLAHEDDEVTGAKAAKGKKTAVAAKEKKTAAKGKKTAAKGKKTAAKGKNKVATEGKEEEEEAKKARKYCTPYKASDLVPLLKTSLMKNPNTLNMEQ